MLLLTGLDEIGKKNQSNHFWPVFGLLWPWYQCPKLSKSIFDPVLTGLSEIGKIILSNNDFLDKNADFGPFGPFLACF